MELKYTYDPITAANFNPFSHLNRSDYKYPKDIFTGFIDIKGLSILSLKHPGVYLIHHQFTDKVYIGGTVLLTDRINRHISLLKGNRHYNRELQDAYNLYPYIDIYFKPLESKEAAHVAEQELLDKYFKEEYIFNLAPNAITQEGLRHSDQTIEKMKATRNKPEMKAFISNLFKGKPLSEEHKRNVGLSLKGRKVSDHNKQITSALFKGVKRTDEVTANIREAILAKSPRISINGVIYRGCGEAARSLGIKRTTIQYRLNSKSDEFKDWYNMDKI